MATTPPDPFTTAQAFVLKAEGGYSNNPHDPGGPTMLGVTMRNWAVWTGRAVTIADMHALTPAMVLPFYKANYWRPINGDKLPPSIALLVYQAGVNEGVKRAAELLQEIVGTNQDGDIGSVTLAAVRNKIMAIGNTALMTLYCNGLRAYYRSLPTFATFGTGWLNRVNTAYSAALVLVPK